MRSRVSACSPQRMAVLVDGREVRIEAPDNLRDRYDLIVEQPRPGGGMLAALKGTDRGTQPVPPGFTALATVSVPRGCTTIHNGLISPADVVGPGAAGLPAFSGDHPECPKCWHIGARTEYLAFGTCEHSAGYILGCQTNERLHRECARCDYMWDEATAEQIPPVAS